MALPASGQISMNDIRVELGIPSQSPFELNTAIGEGYVYLNECSTSKPIAANPDAISEWYSYNHSATCTNRGSFKFSTTSCANACAGPFTTTVYSCGLSVGNILRTTLISPGNYCGGPVSDVNGFYSNGTTCYAVSGQAITSISNCPTPTPTPTPTSTPTPTPSNVTITVYHKRTNNTPANGYSIHYKTAGGSCTWTHLNCTGNDPDCNADDNCSQCGSTFTVAQNTDIEIAVTLCQDFNTGLTFNAEDNTSTCPSNSGTYCEDLTCTLTPFSFNSGTSNKNIAITVFVNKFGYLQCV